MNAIPLINNIPKTNINNEKQLRQEINTSLVALKKEAGTLEGLINEAAQMLVTINNRIATLENDTVKKSDIVDVVQSGNLQPVTSNAVAGAISTKTLQFLGWNTYTGNTLGIAVVSAMNSLSILYNESTEAFFFRGTWAGQGYFQAYVATPRTIQNYVFNVMVQYSRAVDGTNENTNLYLLEVNYNANNNPVFTLISEKKFIRDTDVINSLISGSNAPITSGAVASAYDKILTSKRLANNASVYIKSDTNAFFNSAIIMVTRDGLNYLSMGVVYWEYNNSIRVSWVIDHTTNIIEVTKISTLSTQIKNISGYPISIILMNRGDFYFSDTQ